ncbi:hypothetical protein IAQ61_006247 [Plenodomus lingam]|uniref:Predicted protein n=1 Tax=Leptosphaeria maculans (strain JN3 / isolate v23.1.3 / race Av1-4-5-6-7-8) TaxID=985895 RepID=E4ZM13_LEPMJ|nr:predicted protein [Plenodomus lingam JN3]KAH9870769.1 hypothetical protein IAQ61_006247 [Plenodomus lingam]CBX92362.1 predicted protein [Plenodomus lingam JN3]
MSTFHLDVMSPFSPITAYSKLEQSRIHQQRSFVLPIIDMVLIIVGLTYGGTAVSNIKEQYQSGQFFQI